MLSSVVGLLGNKGQSNYGGGNVYQDMLAKYRVAEGQPALAIDLGPVEDVGYIVEQGLFESGFDAHSVLRTVSAPDIHAMIEYAADPRIAKQSHSVAVGLKLQPQRKATGDIIGRSGQSFPAKDLLRSSKIVKEATDIVYQALQHRLVGMLSLESMTAVDLRKPLDAYGVDSLAAVELRDWIAKDLGAEVPTVDILGNRSIESLGAKIVAVSNFVPFQNADK